MISYWSIESGTGTLLIYTNNSYNIDFMKTLGLEMIGKLTEKFKNRRNGVGIWKYDLPIY